MPAGGELSPATERRLVSVLFVDLVGFTPASEQRDAEDTREFLGRYFDTARTIIERYGGTVEKFIGDAVMAVWGAPTAHEDDAERAVRAGLELVSAVPSLDESTRPQARGGVLTGEAAVASTEGEGFVTGDIVNTASRLQSAAPPGMVYVGDATFRAASKSITFEQVEDLQLKGKSEPVAAWRATGVASLRGGHGRNTGLEPPFVGRDDELRLLKDLFHATERERKARLVSVVGQGGIGKSRLAWELEKYLDGVVDTIYWHAGRSPAYGDGISYWALAEMVRQRANIAETDDEATAMASLRKALDEWVPDPAERSWIEPRLAGLLALAPMPHGSREELFGAWRTFFERIAAEGPTVLLFEDIQWADQGMLDFVEHLLDAGRGSAFFVITLARPELFDRRPSWSGAARSVTSMSLDPLAREDVQALVRGLIPDIPGPALSAIVQRSEGIPLYAVETLRMLIDRGLLIRATEGDHWELSGSLEQLAVPETLQALIAARLDALDPADRTLLQQAAVLGQSFTVPALAAVSGGEVAELDSRLQILARRDLLVHETDPRSPERGQYLFVQGIVREVAHGLLARAERRRMHLAAARYFEALGDDELAGILASHYMDAHDATPAGPEADALAAQARIALRAAAERSLALHSYETALANLEQAIAITTAPADRAALEQRAAFAAAASNAYPVAMAHADAAIAIMRDSGDRLGLLSAKTMRANVDMSQHRDRPAVVLMREALDEAADLPPSVEHVEAEAQMARALMIQGASAEALEWADRVLQNPAAIADDRLVLHVLVTKGTLLLALKRTREAEVVLRGAIGVAEAVGDMNELLRARNNAAPLSHYNDYRVGYADMIEGYELAARIGIRNWTAQFLGMTANAGFELGIVGQWGERLLELTADSREFYRAWALSVKATERTLAGDSASARDIIAEATELAAGSGQAADAFAMIASFIDITDGRFAEASDRQRRDSWDLEDDSSFRWALVAALMLGDPDRVAELAAGFPAVRSTGRASEAIGATVVAACLVLGVDIPFAVESTSDARNAVRRAMELTDQAGLLMWRAFLAIAFGRLGTGVFPEADAILAEGEAFLRERGAGATVDRIAASSPIGGARTSAATSQVAPVMDQAGVDVPTS